MTYEEALNYAKSYLTLKGVPVGATEATRCIVIALEKQIPTKPNDIGWLGGKVGGYKVGACPVCGEGTNYDHCFCSKCGQRLYWGDDDDV